MAFFYFVKIKGYKFANIDVYKEVSVIIYLKKLKGNF